MRILIHGRKNGYTVLYPKPTPTEFYSYASDIQSINANNYDVYYGKNFYAIACVDGGCIFTKYVIGDDVERGQLGEIGISVFIHNTQKLSGLDVKTLLDELINTYSKNYIFNHKIDEPKKGFDWMLFSSLANGYDAKLQLRSSNNDNISAGAQDAAFHYYKSDSELIEHLDKPFQEEYSDYKQILFIDSNLKGEANPLNVLKNSGVEVNPDLKNEYYYLNNYNYSKGVIITANGKPRSDKKGENQIRAKWQVEISYSKDEQCYEEINANGTLSDLSSKIHNYLEIKSNQILLKYEAFNNPTPKTKTITLEIKDRKANLVADAEVQIGTQPWQKIAGFQYKYSFSGEELKQRWNILVKKGDFSGKLNNLVPTDTIGNSVVILEERNIIPINVKDAETGANIDDFEVWTKLTNGYQRTKQLEFVDDQIIDSYTISIQKNGYEEKNITDFQPYRQRSIEIVLKKKIVTNDGRSQKNYRVDAGKYGILKNNQQYYSNQRDGSDVKNIIVPNNGYIFTRFEWENDTLVAQYKKKEPFYKKPKFIAASIVALLFLGIGIWAMSHFLGQDKTQLTAEEITNYVEGDKFLLDKLNEYKSNWEKQKPEIEEKGGGIFGIFGGGAKQIDSTEYKVWYEVEQKIDEAINKRNLINSQDFAGLKKLSYSPVQQSFQKTIGKIDSTRYEEVQNRLRVYISDLTLNEIKDSIDAILKKQQKSTEPQNSQKEPEQIKQENKEKSKLEKEVQKGSVQSSKTGGEKPDNKPVNQNKTPEISQKPTDKTAEIIQYLKGSELDEDKLKGYKNTKGINQNIKNSIQLCLDFWALDGSGNGKNAKTYFSFKNKLNSYGIFEMSKLKAFIDKMSKEPNPSYSKQDKKKGLK